MSEFAYQFPRKTGWLNRPARWVIFGIGMLIWSALIFVLLLFTPMDDDFLRRQILLHSLVTLPILCSIFCFYKFYSIKQSPLMTTVSAGGIEIAYESERIKKINWQDVGLALVDTFPTAESLRLNLFDREGKKILSLPKTVDGFNSLVRLVKHKTAENDQDVREKIIRGICRKKAYMIFLGSLLFLGFTLLSLFMAYGEYLEEVALAESAIAGEATIIELKVAPNGFTKRLIYEIESEGRIANKNIEVSDFYWSSHQVGDKVPVEYVADNPDFSRFLGEQVNDNTNSRSTFLLAGAHFLFWLFFIVAGIFQWKGYDLQKSPVTKKFAVVRFGDDQRLWDWDNEEK